MSNINTLEGRTAMVTGAGKNIGKEIALAFARNGGENGRAGNPKDVADTVLLLAYQDYIAGENIMVDGGRTLGPGRR